ncbi:PF07075 family protein [Bacteriovorax sp. BSW11_IV]|uniref:exo-beta-N-acetylmuramidase NamZ family protein n=1 Tax=Bacteriovorax sp. BSW11_IV TaxID=1353529 RepID=UPI00038A0DCB|nr:DUF1343 domain-containing protein [Bacteriovorax sp. BSW11_IV]EQC49503.1 PF07075 family protein [Bacteriovorax sp. BSW11_IV]
MKAIQTGLERLINDKNIQDRITGNIAYLCHSASVDPNLEIGITPLQRIFGTRLKKVFGPQHGLVSDVQDNMVETDHYLHPFFQIPVYSLYSETRIPTDKMLEGIDTFLVDLQDVGTRVYTYISTMSLLMEACAKNDIKVVILDRPNPAGGEIIEGCLLEKGFESFVGRHPIPQRHGMTMGEMALYANKYHNINCELEVVQMSGWSRSHFWNDCHLPWVNPSPNLSTPESAITFCGTVLYEGTNISEGRGTTRALEVVGHPEIEAYSFYEGIKEELHAASEGFVARPVVFMPTFQKHVGKACGGLHLHPTKPESFYSWRVGQILLREFINKLGTSFAWNDKPYEYESNRLAIDYINGNETLRHWAENNGSLSELLALEKKGMDQYMGHREDCLLYR